VISVGAIKLDPNADPPSTQFADACEDITFKRTFGMNNPKLSDQSPSGFEFSLVNQAVAKGWSDQEVADLVIAFRRQNNARPGKALRRGYIQQLIGKVRATRKRDDRVEEIAAETESPLASQPVVGKRERELVLEQLAELLGVRVLRFIQEGDQLGRENYLIEIASATGETEIVDLGRVGVTRSPTMFSDAITIATGTLLDIPKKVVNKWDSVRRLLFKIVEVNRSPDSDYIYEVRGWIDRYLSDRVPRSGDEVRDAVRSGHPFETGGTTAITLDGLRDYLATVVGVKITDNDKNKLIQRLRTIGWEPFTKSVRIKGRSSPVKKYYWRIASELARLDTGEAYPFNEDHDEDEADAGEAQTVDLPPAGRPVPRVS
jgi:hypothetical protein